MQKKPKKSEIIIDASDEKKIAATITRVEKTMEKIQHGYITLTGDIAYLSDMQAHILNGYKSFYTFCNERFGIGRTMVYNLLLIYKRYGENYDLTEEAKELSVRQMITQIKDEKKAIEQKEAQEKKTKRKHETILDFNFQNAIEWSGDELLDKIKEEIGDSLTIPEGAKIIITITT